MILSCNKCPRDIWLTCAKRDISLAIGHIPGEQLKDTADALSHCHQSVAYKDMATKRVADRDNYVPSTRQCFTLSNEV